MIGYGRLGKILAKQWSLHHQVIVSSPSLHDEKLKNNIQTTNSNTTDLDVDLIILAVKPFLIHDILKEILPHLKPNAPIISLAAGITLEQIQAPHHPIVRAMPNINAEIQASATLLLKNQKLSSLQQNQIEELFSTIGTIDWVNDDECLDMGTILAGSGPAFVFYLMASFKEAAEKLGMEETLAQKLITQTFLGSAKLAQQKEVHFQELIQAVVSPKGTTAAALDILAQHQVSQSLKEAIYGAWQRVLNIRNQASND